jgi:hypothetical protein
LGDRCHIYDVPSTGRQRGSGQRELLARGSGRRTVFGSEGQRSEGEASGAAVTLRGLKESVEGVDQTTKVAGENGSLRGCRLRLLPAAFKQRGTILVAFPNIFQGAAEPGVSGQELRILSTDSVVGVAWRAAVPPVVNLLVSLRVLVGRRECLPAS